MSAKRKIILVSFQKPHDHAAILHHGGRLQIKPRQASSIWDHSGKRIWFQTLQGVDYYDDLWLLWKQYIGQTNKPVASELRQAFNWSWKYVNREIGRFPSTIQRMAER